MTFLRHADEEMASERTLVAAPTGDFFGTAPRIERGMSGPKPDLRVRFYTSAGVLIPAVALQNNEAAPRTTGALSFSNDGRRMATSFGSLVVLSDVRTGRKIRQWSGGERSQRLHFLPPLRVNCKALSPAKGDKGASNSAATEGGGSLRVWDANTGEWKRRLVTGDRWPLCLASSSDGRWLASGNLDGVVQLWDMSSADMVAYPARTLAAHGPIRPSGRTPEQRLKDIEDPHALPVRAVAFDSGGGWFATGGDDQTVKIWELSSGRLLRTLTGIDGGVTSLAFVPQTKGLLAVGSSQGLVTLWDARSGRLQLNLYLAPSSETQTQSQMRSWLAWTPDGFYSGSPGAESLIRWRVSSSSPHEGGQELQPASQFQQNFRRPDVIGALMSRYDAGDKNRS